jgi:hypothetical protein
MTKTLLLGTLFALISALPAQAAPQPIFQVESNDNKAMQPKRTTTLFDDGSWTYDETPADGGAALHRSGTLSAETMKPLRAELAAAKWTHVPVGVAVCHMVTSGYIAYRVNGREVLRSQGCSSYHLDESSGIALRDAEHDVSVAWTSSLRP